MSAIRQHPILICFWLCVAIAFTHSVFSFFIFNELEERELTITQKVFTDPRASWDLQKIKEFYHADVLTVFRFPDLITFTYSLSPAINASGESTPADVVEQKFSGDDEFTGDGQTSTQYFKVFIYPETIVSTQTCSFEAYRNPHFLFWIFDLWAIVLSVAFYIKNRNIFTNMSAFYLSAGIFVVPMIETTIAILASFVARSPEACINAVPFLSQYLTVYALFGISCAVGVLLIAAIVHLVEVIYYRPAKQSATHRLDGLRVDPPSQNDVAIVMTNDDSSQVLVKDSPV
jgi:hypothetical protein